MQKIRQFPVRWTDLGGHFATRWRSVALLIAAALGVAACAESPPPDEQTPARDAQIDTDCLATGALRADLSISLRATLDWGAEDLACEGMRRPDSEGARLRFSGPYDDGEEQKTLTLIFAIPTLEEAQVGVEMPTNVTLVEEGSGRFFTTSDTNACWTDVTEHEPVDENSDQHYKISGNVFCVSPLAEINGSANVTFTELAFTGRVNWEPQE